MAIPVIAIIDVGKTNKKFFLFDESYRIIFEKTATLKETRDEDGDPCEDVHQLVNFVHESLQEILLYKYYDLRAINFSAYGASFVCVSEKGRPLGYLYNYLKAYPADLQEKFYATYDGADAFSVKTASPVLGSLNSGMQLYRMKQKNAKQFALAQYALHLPQFLSYSVTGEAYSDLTSIGCHTNLWDFTTQQYHRWVGEEGIAPKLAPIKDAAETVTVKYDGHSFEAGIGLHDSSAALIPYMMSFEEPFILLSTGTWSISLNPFNHTPLTVDELQQDSLCYMGFRGKPVKASRLFSGNEYETEVKRIAAHFGNSLRYYHSMSFNPDLVKYLPTNVSGKVIGKDSGFSQRDFSKFESGAQAYHQLVYDLVVQQCLSTGIILKGSPVKRIFVDGGFSKNDVFMNLLAIFFPDIEVYAASMAQGTALGAALAIHSSWNKMPIPGNLISLTLFRKPEVSHVRA